MNWNFYFQILLALLLASCNVNTVTNAKKEIKESPTLSDFSKHGTIGVHVVELNSGKVLLNKNEHKRMTPASLTKLFTSGAALLTLGRDHTFETQVYSSPVGDEGKHHLYIKGGGDPTLGSDRFSAHGIEPFFEKIYNGIREKGWDELTGDIIIDNSYLKGPAYPSKRVWEDMANYYGAAPNGLSYKENTFRLALKSPSKIGEHCQVVRCTPDIQTHIDCYVVAGSNQKDSAYIYGVPGMNKWTVQGSIPAGRDAFTIKGAIPYPGLVFGSELKAYLQKKGIRINGTVRISQKKAPFDSLNLIATNYSPKLSEIITVINKKSQNLFADHLLMELGRVHQQEGSWDTGCLALNIFWRKNIGDFSGKFYDGSGLSPFNGVSCKDLVNVLTYMHHSEQSDVFKQTLAIGGIDGTLRSIWKDNGIKGVVIGKSGSMNGVLGYAGYFSAASGKPFAFCVIVNHFTEPFASVRSEIEHLIADLIRNN
ncbi:MAG: D-alanyl-D-alanine carboxypeptidase/D-alanyl-D-alanine-endopeptidase [Marinilabiliaceae bacterium]|nr:D-alanyl-D-alanine carboxypeptidase/D-alanyl-D-alanine-endopeptidase [Marinilabiliaceae bacterium]